MTDLRTRVVQRIRRDFSPADAARLEHVLSLSPELFDEAGK